MQCNFSLSSETKEQLEKLTRDMKCASMSETVTRLIWDASAKPDRHDAGDYLFGILAVVTASREALNRAFYAFDKGFVGSLDTYIKNCLENASGEKSAVLDQCLVYTEKGLGDMPVGSILRSKTGALHDIIDGSGNIRYDVVDYYRFDSLLPSIGDGVSFRILLGADGPQGVRFVHRSGKEIRYAFNGLSWTPEFRF